MTDTLDTLWYTRCSLPTALGLAMQHGWVEARFARQNTRIASLKESEDPAVRASHFDHTLRNSVRYGGSSPAIWAKSLGRQTRLLGLSSSRNTQLILTRPDSGIKAPGDLKGRRFGLPKWEAQQFDFIRATALRGLESVLRWHGLDVPDVELVDYVVSSRFSDDPPQRIPGTQIFGPRRLPGRNNEVAGLLRGEVDAIYLHGASALQFADQLHLSVVVDLAAHPDPIARANNTSPGVLTVDSHLLDHHFESAVTLLDQIVAAESYAAKNPDVARQFIARELNISEFWSWKAYSTPSGGYGLHTSLDERSLAALQDFADFLLRWRFIENAVDVRGWVDGRPLAAAQSASPRLVSNASAA